jgi:uncharacterized damage-inducible protein DinB
MIREMLLSGLHGKHAHIEPKKALIGLSHEDAMIRPSKGAFSSWELLFHIVFWQDYSLNLMKGNPIKFHTGIDWPSSHVSLNWSELVERFVNGLQEIEKIINTWDLNKQIQYKEEDPNAVTTIARELMVVIQHNSYHIGQIIATRRIQGTWHNEKDNC